MWYLVEKDVGQTPAPQYWLGGVANSDGRTIGRKHADIRLKSSSVSRNHARLVVQTAPTRGHLQLNRPSTAVSIIDTSAYGTFLKYPLGHMYARENGRHFRLDKDTPVQIFDGAMLAFGAPSAWWSLIWHPLCIVRSRLTEAQRTHLDDIAISTGFEMIDEWVEQATHLVTRVCNPRSMTFIRALVSKVTIISPTWVEAAKDIVVNACHNISEAVDSLAAVQVTCLPDPSRYRPPFEAEDRVHYGDAVIDSIFDEDRCSQRSTLFENVTFSFMNESIRSRWTSIIAMCGGRTCHFKATASMETNRDAKDEMRMIHIDASNTESPSSRNTRFEESYLIKAILSSDLSVFDSVDDSTVKHATSQSIVDDESQTTRRGPKFKRRAQSPLGAMETKSSTRTENIEDLEDTRDVLGQRRVKRIRVMSNEDTKTPSAFNRPVKPVRPATRSKKGKDTKDSAECKVGNGNLGRNSSKNETVDVNPDHFVLSSALVKEAEDLQQDEPDEVNDDQPEADCEFFKVDDLAVGNGRYENAEGRTQKNGDVRLFRGSTVAVAGRVPISAVRYLDDSEVVEEVAQSKQSFEASIQEY